MQRQATNELTEEKNSFNEHKPLYERVISSQMQDKSLEQIHSNSVYQLGFARKTIVSLAPFTHSAAAFLDINAEGEAKWLIFGRQTPFFLKPNIEGNHYAGGLIHLFHNLTDSKIDNEKKYNFFKNHDFVVEKTTVNLSGAEVKQILQKADADICANHSFDFNLVQSNCYSASVDVLAFAIDVIANRAERDATERANNDRSIAIIRELLTHATQDNFSVGIITHPRLIAHLKEVDRIIAERQIPREYENVSPILKPKGPQP